jgi:hypothetical protein
MAETVEDALARLKWLTLKTAVFDARCAEGKAYIAELIAAGRGGAADEEQLALNDYESDNLDLGQHQELAMTLLIEAILAEGAAEIQEAALEMRARIKGLRAAEDGLPEPTTHLADAGDLQTEVAEKVQGFAARLEPAVETLRDFLSLFNPEECADADTPSSDDAQEH